MSTASYNWLRNIAGQDGNSANLIETALAAVEMDVVVDAAAWEKLDTEERAALLTAKREVERRRLVDALRLAGQDIAAARANAETDEGVELARLTALAAARGVAAAAVQNQQKAPPT